MCAVTGNKTTDGELWANELDDMGPYASIAALKAHLDRAPIGADPAVKLCLKQHIHQLEGARPRVVGTQGSCACGVH